MGKKQYFNITYWIRFVCLCLFFTSSVFAQTKTMSLGGSSGWPALSVMSGVTTGIGRFGYESIQLSRGSNVSTNETDLLLNFEDNKIADIIGNYTISSNNIFIAQKSATGKASGASRGLNSGIRMKGKTGSLFGTAGLTGPFVISFWLNPSIAANGEQILSWRSSRSIQGYPMYQLLTATFFNSRMEWRFTNIFNSGKADGTEFILSGRTIIVPETWSNHTLTYNDQDGLLEYRINGRLEALCYVTSNGKENGTVYQAEIGVPAELDICSNYTGLVDDFSISRSYDSRSDIVIYPSMGGRFETMPLKTAGYASQLTMLTASGLNPPQTDVVYSVRAGDNFYEWTDTFPEWIPVVSGKPINGVHGLYFQVAADLYPDGTQTHTPAVSEIVLAYTETEPPPPPAFVTIAAGDGYIDIQWPESADITIGGYMLYYGEKPGEYLGRIAAQGTSPINTGKNVALRLTGLTNGKLYHFAIAAYTAEGRIIGPLSKEVYARPLRKQQ